MLIVSVTVGITLYGSGSFFQGVFRADDSAPVPRPHEINKCIELLEGFGYEKGEEEQEAFALDKQLLGSIHTEEAPQKEVTNLKSGNFSVNSVTAAGNLSTEYVYLKGAPGTTVTAEVAIKNDQTVGATFSFTPLDSESTDEEDGFFALKVATSAQSEIGEWGSISPNEFSIDSHASEKATFTISIPSDLEVGDTYWGGVVAMEVADDETNGGGGAGVASVIQVGLRVHLEVTSE